MKWVDASWGRFRNHERLLDPRMTRPQIVGARAFYEHLTGLTRSGLKPDEAQEATRLTITAMGPEGRKGALAFARWLRKTKDELQSVARGEVKGGDIHQHTTDHVSVQLL